MVMQELEQRRLTADEVVRMIDAGILSEDEPVELIDGRLVVVSPQGPIHLRLTVVIRDVLNRAYEGVGHVQDHSPIEAGVDSLPEPDIAVVRGPSREFIDRYATGADLILAVEIAYTTYAAARIKAGVYARAGVSEYWLVDVPNRRVEVFTEPKASEYALRRLVEDGEAVALPGLDQSVPVAELLP